MTARDAYGHISAEPIVDILRAGPDGELTEQHASAIAYSLECNAQDVAANPDDPDFHRDDAVDAMKAATTRAEIWAALHWFWTDEAPAGFDPRARRRAQWAAFGVDHLIINGTRVDL